MVDGKARSIQETAAHAASETAKSRKAQYLSKKLQAVEVGHKSISELMHSFSQTGFQAKQLGAALDVMVDMLSDPDATIFFGYAGSMSTTGQWKIVRWLLEKRYVDVLVSTGANISEDILDAMGYGYYQGSHVVDDEDLLRNQIDRFYDVYADELQYREMENLIREFIGTADPKRIYSSAQFLHEFGKFQLERGIESITAVAARQGIPVFSPAMADSGYGVAAFQAAKLDGKRVTVDQFKDFEQLGAIGNLAKETGVIYIGGGVPKDTIQLVAVIVDLARGGETTYPHKYAVQVTTDSPQWGGLSGCTFQEAVSWGKIDAKGKTAFCHCDATIALPLLAHGLLERLNGKERKPPLDLRWVFKD